MEIDIDFIKWKVEKAGKPFSIEIFKNCTKVKIPGKEHSFFIEDFNTYCPNYLKSLLIHKCIKHMVETGRIYHDFNSLRELILDDEKAELWLMHLYNQEKKNGKS